MRIVINVPEDFRDDEIIINLNREEPLPFSDGVVPEDIEELPQKEINRLSAAMDYYNANMSTDVQIEESDDFGGDIDVG